MTSCGYVCEDYELWGHFSKALIFILCFIGGCTGSTAGGIKIFRFQVLFEITKCHLFQLTHLRGIHIPLYQGKKISSSIAASVFSFFILYLFSFFIISLILSAFNNSFLTSISGAISALSNVGPGLGQTIGAFGNFSTLSVGTKITLMFAMLLGRLELITIFVIFSPYFWKKQN